MNMQHRIITWADDGFVLYNHYLSKKKIHIFIPGVQKEVHVLQRNIVPQQGTRRLKIRLG